MDGKLLEGFKNPKGKVNGFSSSTMARCACTPGKCRAESVPTGTGLAQ